MCQVIFIKFYHEKVDKVDDSLHFITRRSKKMLYFRRGNISNVIDDR